MQQENNEQVTVCTAEGDNAEVTSYGKFKTAEELLNAYNSLESEFTRRSQRLKELESRQAERAETDKWEQKVSALTAKYPVARELQDEIAEELKSEGTRLEDDNCLEKALLGVLAKRYESSSRSRPDDKAERAFTSPPSEASDKYSADYERRVRQAPKVAKSSGEIPVAKYPRVTTIAEAKRLATEHLKKIKGE